MANVLHFFWIEFLRACLPMSFLIACIFAPVTMLTNLRELPRVIRWMWNNPI
jgi:hypothetical protein